MPSSNVCSMHPQKKTDARLIATKKHDDRTYLIRFSIAAVCVRIAERRTPNAKLPHSTSTNHRLMPSLSEESVAVLTGLSVS